MNKHRTDGRDLTIALPSVRERRVAKALAVIKAMVREPPEPVAVPIVMPDATYTFWGHPNDTPLPNSIVYFMYSGGRIKIGFSTGLRGRHNGLKKAGPFPPVVLMIMQGGEDVERQFHARFSEDRLHGEWFALSLKLRSFLRLRLCDRGLASFERAEAEFMDYCTGALEGYKVPKRKPRAMCEHGKPTYQRCYPCERDRDLATLDRLNAGNPK